MSRILDVETAKINMDNVAAVTERADKDKTSHYLEILLIDGKTETVKLPEGKQLKEFSILSY